MSWSFLEGLLTISLNILSPSNAFWHSSSTPGSLSFRNKATSTRIFTAALFVLASSMKQNEDLSKGEGLSQIMAYSQPGNIMQSLNRMSLSFANWLGEIFTICFQVTKAKCRESRGETFLWSKYWHPYIHTHVFVYCHMNMRMLERPHTGLLIECLPLLHVLFIYIFW